MREERVSLSFRLGFISREGELLQCAHDVDRFFELAEKAFAGFTAEDQALGCVFKFAGKEPNRVVGFSL
jgi:hypothetical protein